MLSIPIRILPAVLALMAATLLPACSVLYSKRIIFKNHPIALRVESKVIDEETVHYVLKFRNVGKEILSFDYTVADEPGVPHVDSSGPDSGYIPNLYPGAELEVENPTKKMAVWVTLGTVAYGKRSPEELSRIYKPDAPVMAAGNGGSGIFPGDPSAASADLIGNKPPGELEDSDAESPQ